MSWGAAVFPSSFLARQLYSPHLRIAGDSCNNDIAQLLKKDHRRPCFDLECIGKFT
jgi:hypothetical protein